MVYYLFAGSQYYPQGGISDLQGTFTTMKEAMNAAIAGHYDWVQIVKLVDNQLRWVNLADRDNGELTWVFGDVDQ